MTIQVRGITDVGLVRSTNEDAHAWWVADDEEELEKHGILLVVADGMGGALAGEEASRLAVRTVLEAYEDASGEDPLWELAAAVQKANVEVYAMGQSQPEFFGMGTTCTAVVIKGPDLLIAHVGDSRAYLIRDDGIRCLTRDHSLVAELVQRGQITAEQARTHPRRNIVTRAVGVGAVVEVDAVIRKSLFRSDAILLLSSDGLHGVLDEEEILQVIRSVGVEDAGRALVARANERGGPDNVTVVLAWRPSS